MTIQIEHGALPNANDGCGFVPMLWLNGEKRSSSYASQGMTADEAQRQARVMAEDEASRYVGDWDVTVAATDAPPHGE